MLVIIQHIYKYVHEKNKMNKITKKKIKREKSEANCTTSYRNVVGVYLKKKIS